MSEADKMFEELGYKKFENEERISYLSPLQCIDIVKDIRAIDNNGVLFMEHLKAINKKCKELGWIE